MRENRSYGSEGGGCRKWRLPTPIYAACNTAVPCRVEHGGRALTSSRCQKGESPFQAIALRACNQL